jgi:CRP-like cAMP-binding protein
MDKPLDLAPLFRSVTECDTHPAGETIFTSGDASDNMYVVMEGEVDLIINGVVIETVQSGSIFGEMGLIDKGPRSATARARTDCRLVSVDEKRFGFLCQQTPYFALQLIRLLVSRIRKMDTWVRSDGDGI